MHVVRKGGLLAAVTAVVLAGMVSAASAATINRVDTGATYSGAVQLRGTSVRFSFPDLAGTGVKPTITCSGNGTTTYGVIGNGTTSTSSITSNVFAQIGSFSALYLGNGLTTSASAPTACTSTYPQIPSCTAATITNATFAARLDANPTADTGAFFRLGSGATAASGLTVNATCATSGGGSVNCIYTTGLGSGGTSGTAAPIVSNKSSYGSTPTSSAAFRTISFSDSTSSATQQTFYRSGGATGSTCPATGSGTGGAGTISGTFSVYTGSGVQLEVRK